MTDYDQLVTYGARPPVYRPRSDDEARYDANERGRIDAEVLRSGGQLAPAGTQAAYDAIFGDPDPDSYGSPVPHNEPPIFTVISFRVGMSGRVYDYAAVRAGDGKWYATGGETKQGVDWQTLVRAVRPRLVGPVQVLGPIRNLFL
jgi:hypothetical protein